MQRRFAWLAWALCLCGIGCASLPSAAPSRSQDGPAKEDTAHGVIDPAELELRSGRQAGRHTELPFMDVQPAAFEKAATQGRLLLLDCVATWCHWCHVMDETTYRDPQVQAYLNAHFIVLRADVDARPDLAARYENWGWPATVILTPSGEELGTYRGFLPAHELLAALRTARETYLAGKNPANTKQPGLIEAPLPAASLSWLGPQLFLRIDASYDDELGGWGGRHKMALGGHIELALRRAAHGDEEALKRARFTLQEQRALYDPVWGGVYQYSTRGDWKHPHFEKLLPFQTSNLEALSRAFAQTGERSYLDDALRIDQYLQSFLQDEHGAFLVSQDADLGGFEGRGRFVDGHDYFRLDNASRHALGIPRVDRSVYAYENGLGIAAQSALATVMPDRDQAKAVLLRARRAADWILAQRVDTAGAVWRTGDRTKSARYVADAAALGRGLVLLSVATHDARYRLAAKQIAATMLRSFSGSPAELQPHEPRDLSLLLWANTHDPGAIGVFARRQRPFDANVLAARFLLALGDAPSRERARKLLAALSSPSNLADRGFMLAEYLLALDEAGVLQWRTPR